MCGFSRHTACAMSQNLQRSSLDPGGAQRHISGTETRAMKYIKLLLPLAMLTLSVALAARLAVT